MGYDSLLIYFFVQMFKGLHQPYKVGEKPVANTN